jgi:hypothetical protein
MMSLANDPGPTGMSTFTAVDRSVRSSLLLLLILVTSVLEFGCQDVQTVWSAEATSPDGVWVANAHTEVHGGPGAAGVQTIVYLKRTNARQHRILALLDPGPWRPIDILLLSYESEYAASKDLKMEWAGPSHLELTYHEHGSIDFQAVKASGVEISARADSEKPIPTSH